MTAIRRNWRVLIGLAMLAVTASVGLADTVYLVDGGSYRGKVRVEGDHVIVEFHGGTITLDRERVARIEPGDDIYATLVEIRRGLDPQDAPGRYRLGVQAAESNLPSLARELFAEAVKIQPDYVQANLALGRAFLDGAWQGGGTLPEQLRRWVEAGLNGAALGVGRQALAGRLAPSERRAILELTATAARRLGYFTQAQTDYRALAALLAPSDPPFQKLTTIVELIGEHPTGLYLVHIDGLTQAAGRSENGELLRSGYYSLSGDAVLDHALRDRAKRMIHQGQSMMAAAKAAEITDPPRSVGFYDRADKTFARAEGLNPGIARSYRVEIRRRLIQIRQSTAEELALRFDGLNRQLPVAVKNRQTYRNQLKRMLALLDDIQKELEHILALASDYPQELNLVITWTHEDLATVKAMRKTLEGERDQLGGRRSGGP